MRPSQVIVWALLALAADAKLRRRSACPARSTRTTTVQVTVTRGSQETSQVVSSANAGVSAEASSQPSSISIISSSAASSSVEASSQPSLISIIPSSDTSSSAELPSETPSSVVPSSKASSLAASSLASSSTKPPRASSSTAPPASSVPAAPTTSATPQATSFSRAYPADSVDDLRDQSIPQFEEYLVKRQTGSCTLENAAVRYEWSDLSLEQRADYIKSVRCLQTLPAKTPSNVAAGAKSRFDDFVVAHIQQTPTVHSTANFLSWHRYFIWAYETALRDECGYSGFHPYWNWDRYAADPANSPLFNGNATSIGGNSVRGGCVDGPFKDMSVNVGPGNSLRHNPRCLKRDISRSQAAGTTADKTLPLITGSQNIGTFQDRLQAFNGVHASGHFTIGGDPGGDIYASPGDPAFYLHHAMVDRVWWIWQLQGLDERLTAVAGRNGPFGAGGSLGALADDVNLGLVGEGVSLGSLLDTMGGKGGEFCYIYM